MIIEIQNDRNAFPPTQFRDKPIPAHRLKKQIPVPNQRTTIRQKDEALKGLTKNYEISKRDEDNPLFQLQETRTALNHHLGKELEVMKGLKFSEN